MRLLHITEDGKLEFTKDFFRPEEIPPYAILSHTWGDEEVVFNDLKSLGSMEDIMVNKPGGWQKIQFCAQQAKHDNLKHFWVDTCCIDKANHTELSEAINSMFRWYQNANKCYVFLSDVETPSSEDSDDLSQAWTESFCESRWFTRGWTLQELLAPHSVEFFSREGVLLEDKESLKQAISDITRVPVQALSGSGMSEFTIDERFSWSQYRRTTREEDEAYCLLGLFGCHLPLIYGEGKERAMDRLRKAVMEKFGRREVAENPGRLNKIRSWLSAPDPSANYHKALKQRQADTGLWLLKEPAFVSWRESAASRLWLYGIPGCGKTIMSSTIIEHLQQHCEGDVQKVTVYFYFTFDDWLKQDPELMLRSLLHQLLQRLVVTPEDIDALFLSCHNGGRQPSLRELLDVIPQVIRQFTQVYIVLDALDECTQRSELMDMLGLVIEWKLDMVHLLLTSRKERQIEMSLDGVIKIDLRTDHVAGDILQYLRNRLESDAALAKWNKDADIREEIEAALVRQAGGMFRWAVCQMDALAKCRNLAALRNVLATLPQTLDQTYDRILAAISEEDRKFAMRILLWLTFSERPLTIEEVAEVAAIDVDGEPIFDCDEVLEDPLEALEICSSLVTVTTSQQRDEYGRLVDQRILALAHYSVQEYLVSGRIKQGPAKQYHMQEAESHEAILRGCIGYLKQFQGPISTTQFDTFALAMYSAMFWHSHFRKAGDDVEKVCRIALDIFSMDSPAYCTWLRLWDPELAELAKPQNVGRKLHDMAPPLYYAAFLGLGRITEFLLSQGADVNAHGGEFGYALIAASHKGHKVVAKLLINANANVNSISETWGSPLYLASEYGNEAIVKLLIDSGADVNATNGTFGNALVAASAVGHKEVVKLLINAGADVNASNSDLDNALQAASSGGHEQVVRVLLESGPGVDLQSWRFSSAVNAATEKGYESIRKLLLENYDATLGLTIAQTDSGYASQKQGDSLGTRSIHDPRFQRSVHSKGKADIQVSDSGENEIDWDDLRSLKAVDRQAIQALPPCERFDWGRRQLTEFKARYTGSTTLASLPVMSDVGTQANASEDLLLLRPLVRRHSALAYVGNIFGTNEYWDTFRGSTHTLDSRPFSMSETNLSDADIEARSPPPAKRNDGPSIESDRESIGSKASTDRSKEELFAINYLASFFSELEDLRSLHKVALGKIDRRRFTRNYRKILKSYYRRLLHQSSNDTENEVTKVLRSRQNRESIAEGIADYLQNEEAEEPRPLAQHASQPAKKQLLENWLRLQSNEVAPEPVVDDVHPESSDIHSDSDSGTESESGADPQDDFEAEPNKFEYISRAESFLQQGSAFRNLILDLKLLILPGHLRGIIETTPKDSLQVLLQSDNSWTNRTKASLEVCTGIEWDWWPLAPRIPSPRDGNANLRWKLYGRTLYMEMRQHQADDIREILKIASDHPSKCHCCAAIPKETSGIRLGSIVKLASSSLHKYWQRSVASQSGGSKAAMNYTPSRKRSSSASSSTTSPGTGGSSTSSLTVNNNAVKHNTQTQGSSSAVQTPTTPPIPPRVIFGVQGVRRSLEIEQVEISGLMNDQIFFSELKARYKKHRSFFGRFLSPFRFRHCKFVKFQRLNANRVFSCGEGVPEDDGMTFAHDYEYSPRHPVAKMPLIDPSLFAVCLESCDHDCMWSILPPRLHDCFQLSDFGGRLNCIPKKKSEFDVQTDQGGNDVAWGIEADYMLSFILLVTYHSIPLLSCFAFWVYWQTFHPGDWQNASVPMLTTLALMAVFWVPFAYIHGSQLRA